MPARIAAVASLLVAFAAAPAGAVYNAPTKIMGKIAVTPAHPGKTKVVGLKYTGKLPTLRKREYMWFSMAGPGGSQCNMIGIGNGGLTRRRMKTDQLDPAIGMQWPSNVQPQWCKGTWVVQYQVMTPFKSGGGTAWRPRVKIAIKQFKIG